MITTTTTTFNCVHLSKLEDVERGGGGSMRKGKERGEERRGEERKERRR